MFKYVIILAGGLGTRLRSALPDIPKPLAPIEGRPFIHYLVDMYSSHKLIISLGYQADKIQKSLEEAFPHQEFIFVREDQPLGTGGAIRKALASADEYPVLAMNGDTYFEYDISQFYEFQKSHQATLGMVLAPHPGGLRYGNVVMDSNSKIIEFNHSLEGQFINAGVYSLGKEVLSLFPSEEHFSFEDFMKNIYQKVGIYGFPWTNYFVDIGLPESWQGANMQMKKHIVSK